MKTITLKGVVHLLVPVPDEKLHGTEWERCVAFLESLLADGALPATTATDAAMQAGFSPSVLRQTKERMGIVSRYTGKPHHAGVWYWKLKEEEPEEEYIPDPAILASIRRKLMRR